MRYNNNEIKQLASDNGYDYVETTSELTGYPREIEAAIVGFDSYEEAQDFAERNGLRLVLLTKHYGWDLWTGRTDWLYEAPELTCEDYGAVEQYGLETGEEEITKRVKSLIEGMDDIASIKEVADKYGDIWEAAQDLDEDDEMVIVYENLSYEVVDQHPTEWSYDSRQYIIAAVADID